jgi:NADP-dependent alcohol dehydrogenase
MLNFVFQNPTKIIFGNGSISQIAGEIPKEANVLITYGGGSALRNGVLAEVKTALRGYDITEFGGIEPNPEYETIMKGVALAREKKIDFLLAVGGGSVIDATKFMAAVIPFQDDPAPLLENAGSAIVQALPIGVVVTLPASGSEMNNRAIISRKAVKHKRAIMNPFLFPRFAILDPTKTYTLPVRQIGNGVVDTFVHVLEQYMTYPVCGIVQDRLAEGLLQVLIEEGPKALSDPQNYDVRANLMWCATMALNGLIGAGVPQDWAAHRIGYELTVLYGMDHAQTLAVLVPAIFKILESDKRQKLLQYGERVWGINKGNDGERVDAAIEKTREFFEKMQLPSRLSAYKITDKCIPLVVEQLKAHSLVNLGERQNVTPEVVEKILGLCL